MTEQCPKNNNKKQLTVSRQLMLASLIQVKYSPTYTTHHHAPPQIYGALLSLKTLDVKSKWISWKITGGKLVAFTLTIKLHNIQD